MDTYLDHLEHSTISLPPWGVFAIWAFAFLVSQLLIRKATTYSRAQNFIIRGAPRGLTNGELSARLTLVQLLMALLVLGFSFYAGGPVWVFSGGGWTLLTIIVVSTNIRSTFYYRALSQPGLAIGSVKLSNNLSKKDLAFQFFGWAISCFLMGILLGHLTFFGAATYLSAMAFGSLRKSWAKEATIAE